MGNPAFYYTPENGDLVTVDLGESLQDLQEDPGAIRVDSFDGTDALHTHYLGRAFMIRILLERFGTAGTSSLERSLSTMLDHLQRGGVVMFSRDTAKTWCSAWTSRFGNGTTAIDHIGNVATVLSASAALAANDEVVLETDEPYGWREFGSLYSYSTSRVVLNSGVVQNYMYLPDGVNVLVRWRDFYPGLWLRAEDAKGQRVKSDARRNWTLDLSLYYSPTPALASLQATPGRFGSEVFSVGGISRPAGAWAVRTSAKAGTSLEDLLGGRRVTAQKDPGSGRRGSLS